MRSLILAALLFLGGCSSLSLVPHVQEATKHTNVTLDEAYVEDRSFHAWTKMWETTNYEWTIQEIELSWGDTLVECFKTPHGQMIPGQRDHHWMSEPWPYHIRYMRVYPGNVEDVDATNLGFAMLPENMDGSVKTTTGPKFNENYLKNHKVQGRVTACDKSLGVTWILEYDRGKMTIWLPDGSIHIYVDKKWYKKED